MALSCQLRVANSDGRPLRRTAPPAAASEASNPGGAGTPGEPCGFQAYWGAQHWTDTQRIKPVIDEVDALGLRPSTCKCSSRRCIIMHHAASSSEASKRRVCVLADVVFSSDNGPVASGIEATAQRGGLMESSVGTTGPFRGNKLSLYE